MPVKGQKVLHSDDKIEILRPFFMRIATITYDKELFDKVSSATWSITKSKTGKEYLKSKQYGLLHQLAIKHFYGEDVLEEAYEKGFVIDHLDNDGFNCTYENLALIPKKENTAKGLTYDIERKDTNRSYVINISKDRATEEFQIQLSFNQSAEICIDDNLIPIVTIYFRYGTDFKTAFIDARSIMNDLDTSGRIEFPNLRQKGYQYREVKFLDDYTPEELESGFIVRDGKLYAIQGSPKFRLISVGHNKELHHNDYMEK